MISKRMQITWENYLEDLIDSGRQSVYANSNLERRECLNEIERTEFAGHLFSRDLKRLDHFTTNLVLRILKREGHYFAELLAQYCITDSPENADRLLDHAKKIVTDFYGAEMMTYLRDELTKRKPANE